MKYDPEIHHRQSIRLRRYDYARAGWYFVTVCARGKEHLFGEVAEGEMVLSEAGRMVQRTWENLPRRFPSIELDAFVVMPNHVHGIIQIVGAERMSAGDVGAGLALPKGAASSAPTFADIVRAFKSTSAIAVNALLGRTGKPLWQRNYYEHIIRGRGELDRIREYVTTNPLRWGQDLENPDSVWQM